MVVLGILQPLLDEVDITLRRLDPLLRLFLEGVQDIHRVIEAHGVNGPIGGFVVVLEPYPF
jgi:hypothetical protein